MVVVLAVVVVVPCRFRCQKREFPHTLLEMGTPWLEMYSWRRRALVLLPIDGPQHARPLAAQEICRNISQLHLRRRHRPSLNVLRPRYGSIMTLLARREFQLSPSEVFASLAQTLASYS